MNFSLLAHFRCLKVKVTHVISQTLMKFANIDSPNKYFIARYFLSVHVIIKTCVPNQYRARHGINKSIIQTRLKFTVKHNRILSSKPNKNVHVYLNFYHIIFFLTFAARVKLRLIRSL